MEPATGTPTPNRSQDTYQNHTRLEDGQPIRLHHLPSAYEYRIFTESTCGYVSHNIPILATAGISLEPRTLVKTPPSLIVTYTINCAKFLYSCDSILSFYANHPFQSPSFPYENSALQDLIYFNQEN